MALLRLGGLEVVGLGDPFVLRHGARLVIEDELAEPIALHRVDGQLQHALLDFVLRRKRFASRSLTLVAFSRETLVAAAPWPSLPDSSPPRPTRAGGQEQGGAAAMLKIRFCRMTFTSDVRIAPSPGV